MDIYTVSFFGHRELNESLTVEKRLDQIIEYFIKNKAHIEFLVGREGEFDMLVSSCIYRSDKRFAAGNITHVLVLPQERPEFSRNMDSLLKYYSKVEICDGSRMSYMKTAVRIRNRDMIDRSDLVVCYVKDKQDIAYEAIQYAVSRHKKVINIANDQNYDNFIHPFKSVEIEI